MAVLRKCEFFLVQKEKSITPTSQRISVFNAFWHNDRNYYDLFVKCDIVLMTACNMWFCSQCKELLLLQKKLSTYKKLLEIILPYLLLHWCRVGNFPNFLDKMMLRNYHYLSSIILKSGCVFVFYIHFSESRVNTEMKRIPVICKEPRKLIHKISKVKLVSKI